MAFIFSIYTRQRLYDTEGDLLRDVELLVNIFPNSAFLKTQQAFVYYSKNSRPFDVPLIVFLTNQVKIWQRLKPSSQIS